MFGMRFFMRAVVCSLPVCAGCGIILEILFFGICEVFPGYNVRGTVLDSETSAPIIAAQVSLQLLRVGEVIGGMTTQTNALGEFEDVIGLGIHTCDFPPELLLGDPPDELQVVVQVDGAGGEVVVPIASDAITIESPGFGVIELPPFEVSLASP